MKVEKTVNIVLEPEEKETVNKFDRLINNICSELCCDICPIKKQGIDCEEVYEALSYLRTL